MAAPIVRVNDRGPFHGDRILDLSYGAAQRLGIVGQGVARVRPDSVHPPRPANADEMIARSEAKTIQLAGHRLGTKGAGRGQPAGVRSSVRPSP